MDAHTGGAAARDDRTQARLDRRRMPERGAASELARKARQRRRDNGHDPRWGMTKLVPGGRSCGSGSFRVAALKPLRDGARKRAVGCAYSRDLAVSAQVQLAPTECGGARKRTRGISTAGGQAISSLDRVFIERGGWRFRLDRDVQRLVPDGGAGTAGAVVAHDRTGQALGAFLDGRRENRHGG